MFMFGTDFVMTSRAIRRSACLREVFSWRCVSAQQRMCPSLKEISKTLTTGHYGNEITVLHMSAKKHKADKIIHAISKGLLDLGDLASQITERLSDSGLYVRLNKQEFVQGRIALQDGGAVKVRIYTPVYVKKNAESEYISLFQ